MGGNLNGLALILYCPVLCICRHLYEFQFTMLFYCLNSYLFCASTEYDDRKLVILATYISLSLSKIYGHMYNLLVLVANLVNTKSNKLPFCAFIIISAVIIIRATFLISFSTTIWELPDHQITDSFPRMCTTAFIILIKDIRLHQLYQTLHNILH